MERSRRSRFGLIGVALAGFTAALLAAWLGLPVHARRGPLHPPPTELRARHADLQGRLTAIAPYLVEADPTFLTKQVTDALGGWEGPAISVTPGRTLVGFRGAYVTLVISTRIPMAREKELLDLLSRLPGAPKWLGARREIVGDEAAWRLELAIRKGLHRPPRAAAVETLTVIPPPRGPGFLVRPMRPAPPRPSGPTFKEEDLHDPWGPRLPEILDVLDREGRPATPVLLDPLPDEELAAGLVLERTFVPEAGPRAAIIGGRVYREGDTLGGVRIHAIHEDRVLLGPEGEAEVLLPGSK